MVHFLNLPSLGIGNDAALQDHVHSALGQHHQAAGQLMNRRHQLAVRIKGDLSQTGPAGTDIFFLEAKPLTQTDQCSLGGIAHLVLLIHSSVTAQQGGTQQRLLQGIVEVHLLHGTGHAGGVQLLYGHLVLGQGAGFIRADDRHAAKAFHSLQLADDGVFPGHFLCTEGQHDRHYRGQRLRNCRNSQCHSKQEGTHDVLLPHKHADAKENSTDRQNADRKLLAETVQRHLQRSLLLLSALQQSGNAAHLGVHTSASNQKTGTAIGHKAAGEHHVLPVTQSHITFYGLHLLFHRQALTGEGTLSTLQAGTLQQSAVCTDGVTGLQSHHISDHHFTAGDLDYFTVSEHLRYRGGHLLQAVQRSGSPHRLHSAQHSVHGNDRQNNNRALHIAQHSGNNSRQNQDNDQKIRKLLQKDPQYAFLFSGHQFVIAELLQPLFCLGGGKTASTAV